MDTITKKRAQRFLYLKYLYELTGGDKLKFVQRLDAGRDLGWDEETTEDTISYLRDEKLIKTITATTASITHLGVTTIERALSQPEMSTEYFPPTNTITIINGDVTVGGDFIGRDKTVLTK